MCRKIFIAATGQNTGKTTISLHLAWSLAQLSNFSDQDRLGAAYRGQVEEDSEVVAAEAGADQLVQRQREMIHCFKQLVPGYQPSSLGLGKYAQAESDSSPPRSEEVPLFN